ncbi:hypothetical protein AAG570_001955 [Ranatra chinensis]|uniref:Uncharacterized protein n=1 Tax=Ranatra chinensis TaxID=642074 RepID=A0ABD0YA07_9HEMI
MASKRRNMFQKNKTQETTENGGCNLPPFCDSFSGDVVSSGVLDGTLPPGTLRFAEYYKLRIDMGSLTGFDCSPLLCLYRLGDDTRHEIRPHHPSESTLPPIKEVTEKDVCLVAAGPPLQAAAAAAAAAALVEKRKAQDDPDINKELKKGLRLGESDVGLGHLGPA